MSPFTLAILMCAVAISYAGDGVGGPVGSCPLTQTSDSDVTILPHSTNCTVFYICEPSGLPALFKCPGILHYNSKLRVCDWPWHAGCNITPADTSSNEGDDGNGQTTATASPEEIATGASSAAPNNAIVTPGIPPLTP